MKTFKIRAYRDDYGYITIEAENKEEALELVEQGEWNDTMYTVKGGSCGADVIVDDDIIEVKNN